MEDIAHRFRNLGIIPPVAHQASGLPDANTVHNEDHGDSHPHNQGLAQTYDEDDPMEELSSERDDPPEQRERQIRDGEFVSRLERELSPEEHVACDLLWETIKAWLRDPAGHLQYIEYHLLDKYREDLARWLCSNASLRKEIDPEGVHWLGGFDPDLVVYVMYLYTELRYYDIPAPERSTFAGMSWRPRSTIWLNNDHGYNHWVIMWHCQYAQGAKFVGVTPPEGDNRDPWLVFAIFENPRKVVYWTEKSGRREGRSRVKAILFGYGNSAFAPYSRTNLGDSTSVLSLIVGLQEIRGDLKGDYYAWDCVELEDLPSDSGDTMGIAPVIVLDSLMTRKRWDDPWPSVPRGTIEVGNYVRSVVKAVLWEALQEGLLKSFEYSYGPMTGG